jgi:transcription initiation factor IIE alpha subunit
MKPPIELWVCPLCHHKTEWDYNDIVTRGNPVCPNCDSDMEYTTSKKDEQNGPTI